MPVPPAVASALLTYAASTDNREITEEAARGWADILDDHVTFADGRAAIIAHRRSSHDYLMPIHVNAEVRRIRKARVDRIGSDELPPADLDDQPARAITWTREYRRAIGDGHEPDVAEKLACAAVGIAVPAQIEPTPRPEQVRRLMAAHGPQCECGCLTKPVRREEGKAS